jgi:hypothetical protein
VRLGCSRDGRVCIHGQAGRLALEQYRRILQSSQRTLWRLGLLGLPPPADDAGRGGSLGYDLYVDSAPCPPATGVDELDLTARFDRASAFSRVAAPAAGEGCRFDAGLARSLGEAVLRGLDAAAHPATVSMASSHLATLVAPCTPLEMEAVDRFQRSPERALLGAATDELSGALLFPGYLDEGWGTGHPAGVMTALVAISMQPVEPSKPRRHNEPDVFDALRRAAAARSTTLGDILLDFAVARAFVGSRSDGAHLVDTERYGDFGRPRFEWSVPWPSLPRRLAPLWPLEPTGVTYLWLDLASAPETASLRFVAEWEEGLVMRWALSKVDAAGREVGRLTAAGKWGDSRAHLTMADLDGLAGILVVGTHLGADDRSEPYDPDEAPARPALYAVTLSPLGG